jgi:CHAT domain-containing protein
MDPAHPMESRLLLNPSEPDGSLYLFEMMSLEVMSSLVILNACNTGTGELQVGEGIMSMARGFQYAGVPSVITTLWPIDDRSSSTIMNFFFQNLHHGMDQRAALAKARNDYIDQSSKASGAPYFWAGQVLIGNPGNLTIRERTNPLLLVITLLLAALIFTSFLVYHKKAR